ncbi:MAG TPA: hypothetical protein VMB74_00180 [Streptosporangiaceae bacterium]|nr:hypothetical protein [Streptosporangiaceae bacterium]
MGRGRDGGRRLAGYAARWSGLSWLSRILLVLSALASLAVVLIFLVFVYLIVGGYSGGNNPTSVNGLLFPVAVLLMGVAGIPATLICALLWTGYSYSRRQGGRRSPSVRRSER